MSAGSTRCQPSVLDLLCFLSTVWFPGRTRASFPRYRQMSAVMTSLSIPSLGRKYSFIRLLDGGAAPRLSPRSSLSLREVMFENCSIDTKVVRVKKGIRRSRAIPSHEHHVSLVEDTVAQKDLDDG